MEKKNNKVTSSRSSIHNGHRERMKQRFLSTKGEDFTNHELLEMLLYYVLPRVNTNEIAHDLLREFGSLSGVFNADPSLISKVKGSGSSTATFILLLSVIRKRMMLEKFNLKKFTADSISKVGNYFVEYYKDKKNEEVCAMLLDDSFKLKEFVQISTGSVNSAAIDIKSFAKYAFSKDATQVILAHNHPSGIAAPSMDDRDLTARLETILNALDINLVEHLIISDVSYTPTMFIRTSDPCSIKRNDKYRSFYNN